MTKVFTALLLADLVVQDKLRLDARLADFMPTGAAATEYEGSAITLLHLATHRSGLPSMPSNNPSPKSDPFSRYTARMLYGFLEMHTLRARPGTAYEYSNLGSALLGHAIERMEKTTYESLVRDRICGPLGLRDTTTYLNEQQSGRLARSYRDGRAVGVWHFDVLVPCGGLHSTMHDMIAFTKANMGALRTTLSPAMERMQTEVPGPGPDDKTAMGLTWRINRRTGIVWHAGLVHGNQTFVAFDRTNQTGIVILSNTYHSTGEALKLGGFKAMSVLRRPATK
jgi:CubicO group peptidase (beta-lactamase class C family)